MGFNYNKFAAATGLMLNRPNSLFYGSILGYPVYCKYITGRSTAMTVRVHAKTEDPIDFSGYLESWRQTQTGIVQISFNNHEMTAMLSIPAKNTNDVLSQQVYAIVNLLQQSGLRPCCMSCGRTDSWSNYLLDGEGCTLCSSCVMTTQENMAQIEAEKTAQPINPMGALIGIIIGAAVLGLMTFFVMKMGYITYLTGFLGAFITMLLIKKLGGRLTYASAIIGAVVCMLVAAATPAFELAGELAKYNQENKKTAQEYCDAYKDLQDTIVNATSEEKEELEKLLGGNTKQYKKRNEEYHVLLSNQTTWECFTNITTLCQYDLYSEVKGELIKCILWGVLSVIISTACMLPSMLKESYGKHSLTPLS